MKKVLKNSQMVVMRNQLAPLLSHTDKLGYIAARNARMLTNNLIEYERVRDTLIEKYGEQVIDQNGAATMQIKVDSPEFKKFCDEIAPFNEMEHEVELMTAKFEDTIGCLSGEEILAIDWMLED